ncbi:sulfate/molybdate ABC transporter ATP-binding protein [Undibacterium terreum]|uniref:ABC transporter ATP-binding protein n=1 Tax=Undibacterium terreum TaxID=1224302 RepID=A0A916UEC2_9BURK|nr:ATP-binding cassette domain-containing protein [Undibacterium terreum]GGC67864.1 ABC transporter ATP-binding protein [Undibacterium terreum]
MTTEHIKVDIRKTLKSDKREFMLDVHFASSSDSLVIFGPSGAGKSLTLQAIAGLLTPDSGRIELSGATLYDSSRKLNLAPQARKVGFLFQNYALFPHLNVQQNVGFGLHGGWRNPGRHQQDERVAHWLKMFELEAVAGQYPHQLSGGQQQRTALARALASDPRALLLDEPFAALDSGLRNRMRHELMELRSRLKIPLIMITHDSEDVRLFGDEVLEIRDGRIKDDQIDEQMDAQIDEQPDSQDVRSA